MQRCQPTGVFDDTSQRLQAARFQQRPRLVWEGTIETDAYELLVREKRDPKESFSRVIRRLFAERPTLTAGELLDAMQSFEGKGAGPRRKRSRHAAA